MLHSVTLRPARAEDASTIRRLVRAERLDPTSLRWPNFLVAEEDGAIIGIGQVKPYSGGRELGSLVVLPAHRHQGVGSLIVRALIEREQGELFLFCQRRLEPYYERFGFRRAGRHQLRGTLRRKYLFARVFRLFGVNVIAMKREAPAQLEPRPSGPERADSR